MTELDPRVADYHRKYGKGPFLTGDSVVVRHRLPAVDGDKSLTFEPEILLVQRAKWPGEGMWALPGGFMNYDDESALGCAVRELDEETKLRVETSEPKGHPSDDLIKAAQRGVTVIGDAPERDPRARIVSHCFLFDLRVYPDATVTVEAADDAAAVTWKTPTEIDAMTLFADHNELIRRSLRLAMIVYT
jgi:bifunctional NMN adenylyltransferase/nudix hydrolase